MTDDGSAKIMDPADAAFWEVNEPTGSDTPADVGHAGRPDENGGDQQPSDAGSTITGDPPPSEAGLLLARPPMTRRLDLACGQNLRAGYEGVDIWPGAQHVVDLQRYPWPFEDESVAEINCSHYIEHIPMEMVKKSVVCPECEGRGWFDRITHPPTVTNVTCGGCVGRGTVMDGAAKDALFAFFDECYRILVPEGRMDIVVPAHRNDRAFQDPTHRRFITAQTFAYMNEQWRRDQRLDHYNAECNFVGDCNPVVDQSLTLRQPEVAQKYILHNWNTVIDWTARLQKKPRLPPRGG